MSYEEVFTKVKEISMKADVSRVEEHLASQSNITGEGEGVSYAEVKDGVLRMEPYEYYDRDARFICSVDTLMKLTSGKLGPAFVSTTGRLKVGGSLEKALMLRMFVQAGVCTAPESRSVRGKGVRYMGIKGWMLGLAVAGAAGEYGIARYFFRRTAVRGDAKRDRIQKMAGTDWDAYIPGIRASREWLTGQPQEDMYITSRDEFGLHGTFFCRKGSRRVVVCFHSYTSEGLNDYTSTAKFYLNQGFNLMVVDERAHGKSEGTYIGLGCLDRYNALQWMEYVAERLGEDCRLMLYGIFMGAATVLMSTGLGLPEQVKAAVSDCAFTSVWRVFSHVLRSMYHMPAFPVMQIADHMARREAGHDLDECSVRKEVMRAHIPILFIHGGKDTFVPCPMVYELYGACASPKEPLVISGASHAEAYYKDMDCYEYAIEELIARISGKEENRV